MKLKIIKAISFLILFVFLYLYFITDNIIVAISFFVLIVFEKIKNWIEQKSAEIHTFQGEITSISHHIENDTGDHRPEKRTKGSVILTFQR